MTEQDLQSPLLLPVDSTPAFQVMCHVLMILALLVWELLLTFLGVFTCILNY